MVHWCLQAGPNWTLIFLTQTINSYRRLYCWQLYHFGNFYTGIWWSIFKTANSLKTGIDGFFTLIHIRMSNLLERASFVGYSIMWWLTSDMWKIPDSRPGGKTGKGQEVPNQISGWLMWICCDDATRIVCFLSFWFLFLLLHTCLLLNANISQQCLSDLLASRVWNLCWKTTCVCNVGFALITRAFWQDGNIIQSVICL